MPGEFPKAFAANPVQKLGEMVLNINLPDAPTTSDGTYTVEFSAGKTCSPISRLPYFTAWYYLFRAPEFLPA